jgi:hypothetical protein
MIKELEKSMEIAIEAVDEDLFNETLVEILRYEHDRKHAAQATKVLTRLLPSAASADELGNIINQTFKMLVDAAFQRHIDLIGVSDSEHIQVWKAEAERLPTEAIKEFHDRVDEKYYHGIRITSYVQAECTRWLRQTLLTIPDETIFDNAVVELQKADHDPQFRTTLIEAYSSILSDKGGLKTNKLIELNHAIDRYNPVKGHFRFYMASAFKKIDKNAYPRLRGFNDTQTRFYWAVVGTRDQRRKELLSEPTFPQITDRLNLRSLAYFLANNMVKRQVKQRKPPVENVCQYIAQRLTALDRTHPEDDLDKVLVRFPQYDLSAEEISELIVNGMQKIARKTPYSVAYVIFILDPPADLKDELLPKDDDPDDVDGVKHDNDTDIFEN